jgi:predicted nucleotidyltransferase
MSKSDRGPRFNQNLPPSREIAEEAYRVGEINNVEPSKVILFGSYATGDHTKDSDVDVVVVSSNIEEDDFYARSYYWDWDWDYDTYPELDLIVLRPEEFEDYKNRENHIVSTAVDTGEIFKF